MRSYLDFEKPVAELEAKVEELRALGESDDAVAIVDDDRAPRGQGRGGAEGPLRQAHALAEDPGRAPSRSGRISSTTAPALIDDFTPLAGDRNFAEDEAIVGGFGRFRGAAGRASSARRRAHTTETRIRAQLRHGAPGGLPQGGRG